MSLSSSPRVHKGGLVLVDPGSGAVKSVIAMQYNPEKLSRSFQVKSMGEGADRADALRLTGPATETIQIEAEIDATDRLEFPGQNAATVEAGIGPDLAILEGLVNPTAEALNTANRLASSGVLEIAPAESPLVIFVWGANRIVPVQVMEFSATEDAFSPTLDPILATVSLSLRVLNVDDLGFDHQGGGLFMAYLQSREALAKRVQQAGFETLGIGGLP